MSDTFDEHMERLRIRRMNHGQNDLTPDQMAMKEAGRDVMKMLGRPDLMFCAGSTYHCGTAAATTRSWTDSSADPIGDIREAMDKLENLHHPSDPRFRRDYLSSFSTEIAPYQDKHDDMIDALRYMWRAQEARDMRPNFCIPLMSMLPDDPEPFNWTVQVALCQIRIQQQIADKTPYVQRKILEEASNSLFLLVKPGARLKQAIEGLKKVYP